MPKRLLRRGLVAALLSLGLASSAAAQISFGDSGPDTSGLGGGAKADVDVIGNILYNSNVAASDAQIAKARGLTPQDVEFSPTVSLNLVRPIGRGEIFLNGTVGYNFYAVNTILDREQVNLVGGAVTHFLLCQEAWTGNLARQQGDLNQQSILIVRNTSSNEGVTLAVNCGGAEGLAPGFSVSQRWSSNSNVLDQVNNNRAFLASVNLDYKRPALGSIGFYGEFNQIVYEDRTFIIGGETFTEGFDTYTGGLRYVPRVGARITGVFTVGYTDLQPTLPVGSTFSGLTYSAEADYAASGRISTHASFSRAILPSPYLYSNFSVNEREDVGITYRMSPRVALSVDGSAQTSTYHVPEVLSGLVLTQQTIYSLLGALAIDLNRRLSLTLILGGQQRDANQPGLSYSNLRAGLTAKAAF